MCSFSAVNFNFIVLVLVGSGTAITERWQVQGGLAYAVDPTDQLPDSRQLGLRPESCWNDCLTRRKRIRLCVPSHVAYEVGAARQQTVRSPRTMYPHSQEWHRNREATMYLPA